MSAIRDIVHLGQQLAEAEDQVNRLASITQAIAEAEARLAARRAEEAEAEDKLAAARAAASVVIKTAQAEADAERRQATVEAKRIRDEAEREKKNLQREAAEACDAADAAVLAKSTLVQGLESEETRLAQSVSALRAELEQLRSRILG